MWSDRGNASDARSGLSDGAVFRGTARFAHSFDFLAEESFAELGGCEGGRTSLVANPLSVSGPRDD